jgi:hypothetical protein
MSWRAYIEDRPWEATARLHLSRDAGPGRIEYISGVTIQSVDHNTATPPMAGILGPYARREEVLGFLRAIMDEGWKLGVRPTAFQDHTNELTAVRYHLEDMRKLAKVK